MNDGATFHMVMRETSLARSYFTSSFAKEIAARIADIPLADICEQGGTAADATVNVHEVEYADEPVRASIELIFVERFPLGCGNALTERPRRARFAIELNRATRICTFTRIDSAHEPDL